MGSLQDRRQGVALLGAAAAWVLIATVFAWPVAARPQDTTIAPPAGSGPIEAARGLLDRLFGPRESAPLQPSPRAPVRSAPAPAAAPPAPDDAQRIPPAPPVASPSSAAPPTPPEPPASQPNAATPVPAAVATPSPPRVVDVPAQSASDVRLVALILPAKGSAFGRASELARQGFLAARGVAEIKLEVQIYETDGTAESAALAIGRAIEAQARVIVGPLTRVEVGGVARMPLKVPTLALNTPEGEVSLPHNFYALSLNTEAEARAAAHASYRAEAPVAVMVTTAAPLSRRAASAFGEAWTRLGGQVREGIEFSGSLGRVRQAVDRAQADIIFLATDAERARLLRPYLGRNAQVIGTSQVFGGAPRNDAARPLDLNGVRFVDMPWLHQPDHAATMVYPRPEGALAPDLERLYALGIDAYRIALELARDRTGFEVDGVTGNLRVREGVIEREPMIVEYRDGATVPVR